MNTVRPAGRSLDLADLVLTFAIVALALATAAIHAYLGGLLFLANAAGYTTLALALVVPVPFAHRFRPLVRIALLLFAAATIAGWVMFGARFDLAYLDKGIELALVALLLVAIARDALPSQQS